MHTPTVTYLGQDNQAAQSFKPCLHRGHVGTCTHCQQDAARKLKAHNIAAAKARADWEAKRRL